jgi:hypothetical protein
VSKPLAGSCHCGAVRLTIPAAPEQLTRCNCTLCTKLGTTWCYFPSAEVQVEGGPLEAYVRADAPQPFLRTERCANCGCVTNWRALVPEAEDRMGINANLFEPEDLAGIEIRACDGRSWDV